MRLFDGKIKRLDAVIIYQEEEIWGDNQKETKMDEICFNAFQWASFIYYWIFSMDAVMLFSLKYSSIQ